MSQVLFGAFGELRYEPTKKRIRAYLGEALVVDTLRAVVVWEPNRIVPSYAVPAADLVAELVPAPERTVEVSGRPIPGPGGIVIYDPSTPFAFHTVAGRELSVRAADDAAEGAAFGLVDPALGAYVILDFAAFHWLEEDEPVISHPHDPFSHIDIRGSRRHLRLEYGGHVVAETDRALMLFEGVVLPPRYYLPSEDVRVELRPSTTRTICAYKGHATYWSAVVGDEVLSDLVWGYPEPLPEAAPVRGLVSLFTERLDVVIDGVRQDRPVTPWS